MPYGLFHTSYSHNPARYSHIVKLALHFYAHIFSAFQPTGLPIHVLYNNIVNFTER